MSSVGLFLDVILPQLAGLAALRLLRRHLLLAAMLVPPISAATFVVPTWHAFSVAAEEIASHSPDEACGAFGAMMLIVTMGGGCLHLLASLGVVGLFAWVRSPAPSNPDVGAIK